jgi:hypothetical protein
MTTQDIQDFIALGNSIRDFLNEDENKYSDWLEEAVNNAHASNPWFIPSFSKQSLLNIASWLTESELSKWMQPYQPSSIPKRIGLIMAGNIPLVGFHDMLSVLLMGHIALVKQSSKDQILLPTLIHILTDINSKWSDRVVFEENNIKNFDAVIATGSNNSSRYFNYYFGKYPSIIRKNRNSVAIVRPNDDLSMLEKIANDALCYFGLGCRSVSHIYLPEGFDTTVLMNAFENYSYLADNFKYFNNYEYNRSIYLINMDKHLDNGFLILKEDHGLASPVSVIYYSFYRQEEELNHELLSQKDQIQCIVGSAAGETEAGSTQFPKLSDWADELNVLDFLAGLE